MEVTLNTLKAKHRAIVKNINGGDNLVHRLESMGLRVGKTITVMSAHLWRGPVTILVDKTTIAIGHGMASKIVVEKIDGR